MTDVISNTVDLLSKAPWMRQAVSKPVQKIYVVFYLDYCVAGVYPVPEIIAVMLFREQAENILSQNKGCYYEVWPIGEIQPLDVERVFGDAP